MGNLAEHKLYLIQLISAIDNPSDLEWLEQQLEQRQAKKKTKRAAKTSKQKLAKETTYEKFRREALDKPYRDKLDIEAIKKEQGWTGQHDREGMMRLIREMDIKEPVEDLLARLTP